MENKVWKKTVGTLIGAIWLYTLANIAGGITNFVDGLLNPVDLLDIFKSFTEGSEDTPLGTIDFLGYFFSILIIIGYIVFFNSLSRFISLQRSDSDITAVKKIRKAYYLMLVAIFIGFVPVIGMFVAFIITLVAYGSMLSGYKSLRDSYTLSNEARQGAASLRSATIWLLVGYIIGCLPFCGVIESLISFIAFFFILSGWNHIRQGAPELTEEEYSELLKNNPNIMKSKSVIPIWWIPSWLGLNLIIQFCTCALFLYAYLNNPEGYIWEQELFEGITILQINNWLYVIYNVILIIGCCFLFFSKKVYLNPISKVGILLFIIPIFIRFSSGLFFNTYPDIYYIIMPILSWVEIAGIILFVWNIAENKTTKIVVTVYTIIYKIVIHIIMRYLLEVLDINIYNILYYSLFLFNDLICFIIVLIKAIQCSKVKQILTQ